jgi:hypothetical protein
MRAKTLLLTLLVLAGVPGSALAQKTKAVLLVLPAPSEWKSQSGTLEVTSVQNGVMQGTFTSNNAACGQTPAAITGKLSPPKLTFAALLPACKTIIWWRGMFTDRALATGVTTTAIQVDGTVSSGGLNGNLFSRTK